MRPGYQSNRTNGRAVCRLGVCGCATKPETNLNKLRDALKEATGGLWVCVDIKTIPNTDQTEEHKVYTEVPKTQTRKHTRAQVVTIALRLRGFATRVEQQNPRC